MKNLKDIGEHNAIAALTANLKATGDDCAVLPQPGSAYDLVLTSDPLIQGVHFTPDAAPEQIGHKAVARVLSDFAAMGAEPQYLLINVVAPSGQDFGILEKIYAGMAGICGAFKTQIVGGDLSRGPVLELHVFGAGRVPKETALLRSGAKPGDLLYVTGALGGALKSGKHLTFTPRVAEGRWLRQSGCVTAMIDLSDGLATDLRHLLKASNAGAELESGAIPKNGTLDGALFDGEDFELLFTVRADEAGGFDSLCLENLNRCFARVGKITDRPGVLTLDGAVLDRKAYEHFRD